MNALKRKEELLIKARTNRENKRTETFKEKNKNKDYKIDFNKNIYDELFFRREGEK